MVEGHFQNFQKQVFSHHSQCIQNECAITGSLAVLDLELPTAESVGGVLWPSQKRHGV